MSLSLRDPQQTLSSKFSISRLSLFILFSFELISGIFLSILYRSGSAYSTSEELHNGAFRLIQSFHYWCSSLIILFALLCVLTDLWSGRFGGEFRHLFTATVLVFFCALGFQLTGNLLPFDRHGAGTATIEAAIAARLPVAGDLVRTTILGGPEFSPHTVQIWYALHLAITLGAALALILAFRSLKKWDAFSRLKVAIFSLLVPIGLALAVPSPFGSRATVSDYSDFSDKSSWYTQPLHGALVMTSKFSPSLGWLGAILVPSLCALFLFAIPWIADRVSLKLVRSAVILGGAFFGCASLIFGGSFDSLIGTRDPSSGEAPVAGRTAKIDQTLVGPGKVAFNSDDLGCASCHGVDGKKGGAGPSLTHTYLKHPDADYYIKYIESPTSIDPNSTMPAFPKTPPTQLAQIAEYLRSPKR